MKTVNKLIYVSFSEYSTSGISYHVFDEHMREHMDSQKDEYNLLCEVVMPEVDKESIMNLGVAQIDRDLAELHMQVEAKKAKKQQLLAIEHKEGNKSE
jgi:hypothetical protein